MDDRVGAENPIRITPPPHLVLVDLGLPNLDGVDLILGLRARSAVPIVGLTARNEGSTTDIPAPLPRPCLILL